MKALDLLVIGDAMIDITIRAYSSQSGGAHPSDIRIFPGGLANVAAAARSSGIRVGFLGKVGNDAFGDLYEADLSSNGISSFLLRGNLPTGICVNLVTPDGERTMFTSVGANEQLSSKDIEDTILDSCRMIFVSGFSMESAESAMEMRRICDRAKGLGKQVALGGGAFNLIARRSKEFSRLVKDYTDILILNQEETFSLTGEANLKAAIESIKSLCSFFVITQGEKGSTAFVEGSIQHLPAPKVEVLDTTGAGDVFAGTLLAGLLRGRDPWDAITMAHQEASKCVSFMGPRIPRTSDDE